MQYTLYNEINKNEEVMGLLGEVGYRSIVNLTSLYV